MSKQTFGDVFAPIEARYKEDVMQSTWGHLAPNKNEKYKCWIIFCHASDGTLCPIDYDFVGLNGSPWLYDAIVDFIGDNAKEQGIVYRFDGTFKNYKFSGNIRKINTE